MKLKTQLLDVPCTPILCPKEDCILSEIQEDYALLVEAISRLENSTHQPTLSFDTILSNLGIHEEDLYGVEDIEMIESKKHV